MRTSVCALLGVVLFSSVSLNSASAQNRIVYRTTYYYPVESVYYYPPCMPRHYAPSVYYLPRSYYAPPMYYPAPDRYQSDPRSTYPPPMRPTTMVTIGVNDNSFEPATLTVAPGTTVRWINTGKHKHTITSSTGQWDSGDLEPDQVYSATFRYPGIYNYYCRHHKEMGGMVIVK
jgi:plastocyanin